MKTPIKIVGVFTGLFALSLLAVYLLLNSLIASALTTHGAQLTQTPIHVTRVSISPFDGSGQLVGLTIDSPEGYQAQPAIKLGAVKFKVKLGSLLSDKIVIEKIAIDSPEVNFEQKFSGNNLSTLRHNLNANLTKLTGRASNKGGRKFQIGHLSITNAKAKISTGAATLLLPIANVERSHIGAKSDGVTSAEITRIVFTTFTDSALKAVASGALIKEGASSIGEGIKSLFGN